MPAGMGWYRKTFDYTPVKGHTLALYFEGIYNRSTLYVNGDSVTSRPNGYVSQCIDITPWLKEGKNTVAVRVDHSRRADSRWYTGSGIYRDVWLIDKPSAHIPVWGVGYSYDPTGKVNIQVGTANAADGKHRVEAILLDARGNEVAAAKKTIKDNTSHLQLKVSNPTLWDVDAPYLYTLETRITDNSGNVIDADVERIGLRTIHFDPDKGFTLNGKPMKLKGVCLHHDNGALGAAVPREVTVRRLQGVKELGANAVRCSHNPQSPAFYEICDSLGLMVMDEVSDEWEFPKRKWIEGWNQGTPGYDGTADFFEQWIDRDITDMVLRDRCHPSVILWSIGNEVDYPNDPYTHPVLDSLANSGFTQASHGGYLPGAPRAERIGDIARRLATCVRAVDTTRPVTGALAGVVMSNCTTYPQEVDIVGYNYTEGRYDSDHARYPGRVIYGSENRSDYKAWTDVRDREFIAGQFIWTGADYLGESGRWPSRGLGTGLLDFTSKLKPRGHFRRALWCDEPVAYLGAYPARIPYLLIDAQDDWNATDGQLMRVVCYTNQPQARLLLNGNEVGEHKTLNDSTGMIDWTIPFTPGCLTVEAMNHGGDVTATYSTNTVTRPAAIQAVVDTAASSDSIKIIDIYLLDDNGYVCTLADNLVSCHTRGCHLLAIDSGSNSDMSDPTARQRRAHRGHLTAYISLKDDDTPTPMRHMPRWLEQETPHGGQPSITFTSPLLQSAALEFTKQ